MDYSEQPIYLDHATATAVSPAVLSEMIPFLTDSFGLLSQPHRFGQRLYQPVKDAYSALYRLFEAPKEAAVLFTSSGCEAVNHVVWAVYQDVARALGKNHFITSVAAEAPLLLSYERLTSFGCRVTTLPLNSSFQVTVDAIADALTPRTALVSLSLANGLTGTLQRVNEISALLRERGVLLHLEASQAIGRSGIRLRELGADFITIHGGQIHAPKSSGALYVREGLALSMFLVGAFHQGGWRGCELDVPSLIALGAAAKELMDSADFFMVEVARLRNLLEERLLHNIHGAKVLFNKERRLPHVAMVYFPHVHAESLLFALNQRGIYASIGGGDMQKSEYLLAPFFPPAVARSTITFSLARTTLEEEILIAAGEIITAYQRLLRYSVGEAPEWREGG